MLHVVLACSDFVMRCCVVSVANMWVKVWGSPVIHYMGFSSINAERHSAFFFSFSFLFSGSRLHDGHSH